MRGPSSGLSIALATGIACQATPKASEESAPKTQPPRSHAAAQPPADTPSKTPEVPEPSTAPESPADPPVDPPANPETETDPRPAPVFGQSEADGLRLAEDFCRHGGALFGPPTGKPYPKPDDWDYQQGDSLSSCDEVEATTLGTWKTADASATLSQIDVVVEDADGYGPGAVALKQVVTIRSPEGVADHVLTLYGISSFEEASDLTMDFDLKSVVFRDVLGGKQPDFLVHREDEVDGNFEADRCFNTTTTSMSATICGDHPSAPGCIDIPILLNERSVPWSDLSECDEKVSPSDRTELGYTLRYKLPAKGKFVAKWVSKRKMKTSFQGPPKFKGTWSLDELFVTTDPEHRDLLRQWSASDTVVVP